jgi:hypothetical protein
MRIILMIMTALLTIAGVGLGAVVVMGGAVGYADFSAVGDLGDIGAAAGFPNVDSEMRFLGGVWLAAGLGFAYCLFRRQDALFAFLLLGVFIGGIARVLGWQELGVIEGTIPATAIELIFPPVMYFLHRRLASG